MLFLLFVVVLPSLFTHLEQAEEKADALALGIVTVMKLYYVASVYLLSDILLHLSRLNQLFNKGALISHNCIPIYLIPLAF